MTKRTPSGRNDGMPRTGRSGLEIDHPWRVPVSVSDLPEGGRQLNLQPDEDTRQAIARAAGVVALPRLEASYDLSPVTGSGVRILGSVSARVEQTCVVSLEPVVSDIVEPVDVLLTPHEPTAASPKTDLDPDAIVPEPLENGVVDLGVLSVEFLVLGIDPYPRKPGVRFEPPAADDESVAKPFAALAALKPDFGKKSS